MIVKKGIKNTLVTGLFLICYHCGYAVVLLINGIEALIFTQLYYPTLKIYLGCPLNS